MVSLRSIRVNIATAWACVAVVHPMYAAPSSRPGWGSIPYSGGGSNGVTFRVWAPNATSVTVKGTFNGFSNIATPLFSEGASGVWSVDVNGASAGQQYKYRINGTTDKQDPRCRAEQSSVGN